MPSLSHLTGRPTAATAVIAGVGFVGSALVARASYVVGTLPGHHIDQSRGDRAVPLAVRDRGRAPRPGLAGAGSARARPDRLGDDPPGVLGRRRDGAPLLVAAPVTSQDVWAYLGQANVAAHGLDPYYVGPNAVPGPFAHAVAHEWITSPSPYGPLWVGICRLVVQIAQPHPWAGMFLLRLVAAAGIVVTGFALARLCRATGWRAEVALWMTSGRPVRAADAGRGGTQRVGDAGAPGRRSGGSGDGPLPVARDPRRRRAGRRAAAVKVIALVALPFLPLVWHRYAAGSGDARREPPTYGRWIVTGAASVAAGVGHPLLSGPAARVRPGLDLTGRRRDRGSALALGAAAGREPPAPRGAGPRCGPGARPLLARAPDRRWVSWPWASPC